MKNIFISSTFRDMQAERDLVQERVLPALREEARKYGDNVGVIDLRWGVDTSTLETDEGSAKVLTVCLDEIERSHPYMLIFLGERYGWIPKSELIEKAVRNREDKYVTDDFEKSVTALEIEFGALSEQYGELNHCIVCFREPVAHLLDGEEKEWYAEKEERGREKLRALKERIRRDLGADERLITYSCTWDKSAHMLVDFRVNGQLLEEVLTKCYIDMFQNDWKEYETLSWQDKEQLAFRALMESKLRSFVGREALLEEYYQSAVNGTCQLVLQGETGSGKTAIMCKLVERLQKEGKKVFAFFSGAGSMSTSAEYLVMQMVYYVETLLGVEEHFGDEPDEERMLDTDKKMSQYTEWMEQLQTLCSRLPEKVYFCIDALDQLYQDEHVEKLDFFVTGEKVQIISSCTDSFELPMDAMVQREVRTIPALSEEDAKAVAEGILASYSRNTYDAIEKEILRKKSVGSPLYISLLIQRLNMMDAEELKMAMKEEIVALGTEVIRKVPDNPEAAIVSIIQNAIDKISDNKEALRDALNYLAVSRNGLRMQDLQGIFEVQKQEFHTIDFTLLLKYLDTFFYIHNDNRIEFTHKVIRQGLLNTLENRAAYEENVKEHMKALDTNDTLRMREGMYFARIREDEEFAKELIEQAYQSGQDDLEKAIKNEAVSDEGNFYCQIIQKETDEKSSVCDFFQWRLLKLFGLSGEEMKARIELARMLILYNEAVYEKNGSEASLRELSVSYNHMGCVQHDLGQVKDALSYYEKSLKCHETINEKNGNEESLRDLSVSYDHMGRALQDLGRVKEALAYYEKALKCDEIIHKKSGSIASLRDLSFGYNDIGRALQALGRVKEALLYYEKALKCAENFHEKSRSEVSLKDLSACYNNMGRALQDLGRVEEALVCCEKALKCREALYEKNGGEASLRDLSVSYNNMGHALQALNQVKEALSYYEKALKGMETLREKNGNEASLRDLSNSYNNMGRALQALGQKKKALLYYEKARKLREG